MQNLITILLLLSLTSCSDNEKDRINDSTSKIDFLSLNADEIHEFNHDLILRTGTQLKQEIGIFDSVNDTLALIRDELISTAGGYTTLGQYINLPAKNYVDNYFYGVTNYRSHSYEYFFSSLDTFIIRLTEVFPRSKFKNDLDFKYGLLIEHYGIESRENIFKEMTLNEAVQLIEGVRLRVAFEETKYILTIENEG